DGRGIFYPPTDRTPPEAPLVACSLCALRAKHFPDGFQVWFRAVVDRYGVVGPAARGGQISQSSPCLWTPILSGRYAPFSYHRTFASPLDTPAHAFSSRSL